MLLISVLPAPGRPSRWVLPAALLLCSLLAGAAARAGSVTAESVRDSDDARQRALELVPRGASVTRSRCQEFEVGGFNYRYRCTVNYSEPGPGSEPATAPMP